MYVEAYETLSHLIIKVFYNMRCFVMFVTAVCILFLLKLKWPKNKSFYPTLLPYPSPTRFLCPPKISTFSYFELITVYFCLFYFSKFNFTYFLGIYHNYSVFRDVPYSVLHIPCFIFHVPGLTTAHLVARNHSSCSQLFAYKSFTCILYFQFQMICNFRPEHWLAFQTKRVDFKTPESLRFTTDRL